MLYIFSQTLASRMNELQLDDRVRHSVYDERVKLAGLEVPSDIDSATREQLKAAVAAAFVKGFRVIMFTSAALALASAASSWFLIRKSRPARAQQQRN
jgi:hypothetical protein